jgi:hypothetical protein
MHIRAGLGERRVRIRMRNIFTGEERDMAISAVDVFFYGGDGAVSKA